MERQHNVNTQVVVWAISYGLPRHTYAHGDAITLIRTHWTHLTAEQQAQVRQVVADYPINFDETIGGPIAKNLLDSPPTHTPPADTVQVNSSAIIWATRYATGQPDLVDDALTLILNQWDTLTINDQHVITRDLFWPNNTWHQGAQWDALIALAPATRT